MTSPGPGYNYVALRELRINNVIAFEPGQWVPDSTISSQGWVTGTDISAPGAVIFSPTALNTANDGSYLEAKHIGPSNNSDDTAHINALCATGGRITGTQGQTYLITSPIVLPSNTTLDMTQCTIVEKSGSNKQMVGNYSAFNPAATATDAAMTSGSGVVTTALAAQAVVGQTVTVTKAIGATFTPLTGTVTAVNTGAGTITVSTLATATVTGSTVKLFNRDVNITVVGGYWNRGANTGPGGIGVECHSMYFRHVDGLKIRQPAFTSTAGKYSISLASCTSFHVDHVRFDNTYSDGVHLTGPLSNGAVSNIYGTSGDDFVALTAQDWVQYGDTTGDIVNVQINNLFPASTARAVVKVMGGPAGACRNVIADGLFGSSVGSGGAVWIGDDNAQPDTIGGLLDQVTIRNVFTTMPNNYPHFQINGINIRRVLIDGFTYDNANCATAPIGIFPSSAGTITSLELRRVKIVNCHDGIQFVDTNANVTISRLMLADWDVPATQGFNPLRILGTVTDLVVDRYRGLLTPPAAGGAALVYLNDSTGTARVDKLALSNCDLTGTGGLGQVIRANQGTHTLGTIMLSNVKISSLAWLWDLATTTDISMSNVMHASPGQGIANQRGTANVTVRGDGNSLAAGSAKWAVSAGGKIAVRVMDAPAGTAAGSLPTIAAGAGAGAGPTVSVAGTDRAGSVTITPGTGPAAGAQGTVTFVGTWPQTPKVALTPTNAAAQAAGAYVSAKSTTTFAISTAGTPGGSMTFDYVVLA